jgi:hypothetical protein
MPLSVEPGELFRRALDSRAADIWTAFPARVVTYDPGTQTADLEPQVRRPVTDEDGAIDGEDLPVIPNVPIVFPRGGGDTYAITWKIQPNDFVWVHVCTHAIGNWRRTGEVSDPGDVRTHSLGNCFAVPGAAPNSKTLAQANDSDGALVIEAPLTKIGKDATDFAALAAKVNSNYQKIINLFSAWTPVPNDGGAALKTLTASLTFDDVSAAKTKVK